MNSPSRRAFLSSLCATLPVYSFDQIVQGQKLDVQFVNVAREAGLRTKTVFGAEQKNLYLFETTGCGVAFFDYDNDGWLDIFLVNGWRFKPDWAKGDEPSSRLFRNNRDGTFTDVTAKSGLTRHAWGQGVCVGDYDNDGFDDLFVSCWGDCALYHNNGDGTFTDVAVKAGVTTNNGKGWRRTNTGCAFVDYDRDGRLDLFVANYYDFDPATAPLPESGPCRWHDILVACGPPGLKGSPNMLFHNNGDGTFSDVSERAGIQKTPGTFGLGVLVADFDNDGWPDIYVANDSKESTLYRNNHDGTFTDVGVEAGVAYSPDGRTQAGMGVSAADYLHEGRFSIAKTNFVGDVTSLYHNLGDMTFENRSAQAGLGMNTRFFSWGVSFLDFENNGYPGLLIANGHVYPEVGETARELGYQQRKILYRNLGNGRFADVSTAAGPGIQEKCSARGLAVGDFDNDGDLDVLINPVNDYPQLLRADLKNGNHWIKVKAVGVKSNRSAIGARIICTGADKLRQMDEVRSGGSFLSQGDLRVHFGLGQAATADIEIHWPSGVVDKLTGVKVDQIITVKEGSAPAVAAP